jgi:Na+/H+-dicarboxylate symporter
MELVLLLCGIFSFYAFIAGGTNGLKVFFNITPALTALGTCSSIATIPANLEAERCTYQHILETSLFR